MIKLFRDKVFQCFFEGKDESIFTPEEYNHVIRLRALFTYWLDKPFSAKTTLVEWMINEFGIEKTKAYADISLVESLLGNVKNANKTWARYIVSQTLLKAIELGEADKRPDAMIRGAEALIKAYSLDKTDEVEIDESKFNVDFEPTDDIRALSPNLKPLSKVEKEKLKQRLLANMVEVTDIDYEEQHQ